MKGRISRMGSEAKLQQNPKMLNSIIWGDNALVMAGMPENSVDLILTSPPYGNLRDYKTKPTWSLSDIADQSFRVLKEGGVLVWVVADECVNGGYTLDSFRHALAFQERGFRMYQHMFYEKTGHAFPPKDRYYNQVEFMFVLSKGKPKTVNLLTQQVKWDNSKRLKPQAFRQRNGELSSNGKITQTQKERPRDNLWRYVTGGGNVTKDKIAYAHPAIFPEKLAEDHILTWTNPGDLVLDPFCGSGTTLKMAKLSGRNWIGIDKIVEYCAISENRIGITDDKP